MMLTVSEQSARRSKQIDIVGCDQIYRWNSMMVASYRFF
jgi:hypothetical protein